MLYHPQSPFYQQFLTSNVRGAGRQQTPTVQNNPVPAAASAAQARAANAEK